MSRGNGPSGDVTSILIGIVMVGGLLWLYAGMSQPAATVVQPYPTAITRSDTQSEYEALQEERSYQATEEARLEQFRYEQHLEKNAELEISDCTCTGNAYNCVDFATGNEAQACYQHCLDVTGFDVHWLDDDRDGSACDWSPRE